MAWETQSTGDLSGDIGDAALYREFSLAMVWPRSAPDCFDDDTISRELRECAATEPLPWSIDDDQLFWKRMRP